MTSLRSPFLIASLFALTCAGCGYTEVHEVVLRQPQPPTAHEPAIYFGNVGPGRPFYEIALLQSVGHGGDADLEETTLALRARAQQLGCDAVVKVHFDQGYSIAQAVGVCVIWARGVVVDRPAPPPSPAPSPPSPPPAAGSTI